MARETIAKAMGAHPSEIVFTSGATESNNLALAGAAECYAHKGRHIVTVATEHPSVLDTCKALERKGFSVTYLPVNAYGFIDIDLLRDVITDTTILLSVMHANNEIGVIQDIEAIGALCAARGVLFHTDATQSFGKIYLNVAAQNVSLASVSAHKIYGPKGIGALYVRGSNPKVRIAEQIHGGGRERGLRSGTLNVPAIAGFGMAALIAGDEMIDNALHAGRLRNALLQGLRIRIEGIVVNGPDPVRHPELRLTGNLNVSFTGVDADALMMDVKEVAVSSGSACASAQAEPSHVIRALPGGEERSRSAIRFCVGNSTSEDEIALVVEKYATAVKRLREKVFMS